MSSIFSETLEKKKKQQFQAICNGKRPSVISLQSISILKYMLNLKTKKCAVPLVYHTTLFSLNLWPLKNKAEVLKINLILGGCLG